MVTLSSTLSRPLTEDTSTSDLAERPLDVLVVEDDPSLRRGLELGLGHLGHLVISAGSVRHAIACLDAFVVDAVICDLRLPDGSGAELIEYVKERTGCGCIIAISADPNLLVRTARTMPVPRIFSKPLDVSEIHRELCEYRSQQQL